MARPLEQMQPAQVWCGRSWEGLVDRRFQAFAHAQALKRATEVGSQRAVPAFLGFFRTTGAELIRDEEEWIFGALQPAPDAVVKARQEHIAIVTLVEALTHQVEAGCADLRVVHRLGELLEAHLLAEEENVRPLATHRGGLIPASSRSRT